MITIRLSTGPSARDMHLATAIIAGREYSAQHRKKSPIPKLARTLVGAGLNPKTLAEIVRGGTSVLAKPVALSWWAGLDIADSDSSGLSVRTYRPFEGIANS